MKEESWIELVDTEQMRPLPHGRLKVILPGGRSHTLKIRAEESGWRFEAPIAKGFREDKLFKETLGEPFKWMALTNRGLRLCALEMDTAGNLLGTSWLPAAGLTGEEFRMQAFHLAAECDRLEFSLTGRDHL